MALVRGGIQILFTTYIKSPQGSFTTEDGSQL